jgi:ferredoxin
MAMTISSECINCGACEPVCPNSAISAGDNIYLINWEQCTECVGYYDEPQCIKVCPVDCIAVDPEHVETKEALLAKGQGRAS